MQSVVGIAILATFNCLIRVQSPNLAAKMWMGLIGVWISWRMETTQIECHVAVDLHWLNSARHWLHICRDCAAGKFPVVFAGKFHEIFCIGMFSGYESMQQQIQLLAFIVQFVMLAFFFGCS